MQKPINQLREYTRIYNQTDAVYRRFAEISKLPDSALSVLYSIRSTSHFCTQAQICMQWALSKQTVNSALKILLRRSLITLCRTAADGRSKELHLTEAGEAFCVQHIDPIIEIDRTIFRRMTAEERSTLLSISGRYLTLLSEEAAKVLTRMEGGAHP